VVHQVRHALLPHAMAGLPKIHTDARRPVRSIRDLVRGTEVDGQFEIASSAR
jgi:hypothetical protein